MSICFYSFLFVLGACVGSFLCCQARRLHLRLNHPHSKLGKRSICFNCKYQLKWYDNIPILSWFFLRGRCRKCKKPIGITEFLSELGLALSFLFLGLTFDLPVHDPWQWLLLAIILLFMASIGFLAIYDGLYGELPTKYLTLAIIIAFLYLIVKETILIIESGFTTTLIVNPLLSILILGGLYLVLYLISKGKWVGDGDWLLGTALGLVLFYPSNALVALFLANLLASLIMAPYVILHKNHHIHFGPFLVVAFVVVISLSDLIQNLL